MEELLAQLNAYLRGMWRYRWWGLVLAWVVATAGVAFVYQMPDQYRSSARVFVDTQSVLRPLMRGLAIQPNVEQQVAVLSRTLITRPNIEKLITMAELDLTVRNQAEREALISRLQSELRIADGGRGGGANMFTLSYQDANPERAQRVVQALVSLFVESGLVSQRKDSDDARRFIDTQIASYEQRLIEAENRVKEFRLRNIEMLGDGNRDFVGQISSMVDQLAQTALELKEALNTRDALREQLEGEAPMLEGTPLMPEMSMGVMTSELDARIDSLYRSLDDLLLRYTDQHPDVIGSRRVIESLEAQRAEELQRAQEALQADSSEPRSVGGGNNPVFQQLRIALSNADARIAALNARQAELEQRISIFRARAEMVPEIEAEQAQLNRDYAVHKRNYDELVSRRESAAITAQLDAQSGAGEFRVIDPPSFPRRPSAPNRQLLIPGAGVAAIGAGIVLTFLLAQLRPTVLDGRMLRNLTGLPLLGTVALIPDKSMIRRRRLGLFVFVSLLLLMAAAVGAAAYMVQILQR